MLSFQHQQVAGFKRSQASKLGPQQPVTAALVQLRPSHRQQQATSTLAAAAPVRQAGPATDVPDYTEIDSQPLNKIVMALFRNKMVAAIGSDSQLSG
jgi:hypothetical protein